ncbi:ABC transporter ATP-binding protein [Chelatococcus reniformis]|uniref:ABC transporter ATP-binding protein n=1 Tax=Chelatococcus reniformis TaxID=1494448 RepID=A0A916U551_9HYPH|nr:ABC transporter ATP-binding protein [Chelatococcus reniformis]
MVPLLEVHDLEVRYGKALAIEQVSLTVEAGEIVGVLGPNGAGKTTLLKAISRAVPARGGLTFKGEDVSALPVHEVVGRGICHCPEGRRLFPELTVRKNLELGAYLRRDRAEIAADMERVHTLFPVLRERGSQQASTLSGGEQQMVAIGRALMGRPALLLLDEPSVGIAHKLKMMIFGAIEQIRRDGTAVLVVEQDAVSTLGIVDRVYVLEHGRVVREGTAGALKDDDYIRQIYLGV